MNTADTVSMIDVAFALHLVILFSVQYSLDFFQ